MAMIHQQHFEGQEIDMTGETYLMCSFRNCVLTRNKSSTPYRPGDCQYIECTFIGDDWPAEFDAREAA